MMVEAVVPSVSVIIPNYNHAAFLQQRIESILNQTWQDFELIILDDCSADNSRDIIEQYRENEKVAEIVYNTTNSGTTFRQWEKGIALARGEIIWIAESDDYAAETFLSTLIKPFDDPAVVISFCRSVHVDENNKVLGITLHADALDNIKWTRDYTEDGLTEIKHYLRYRNTIPNASAVLFKKPADLGAVLRTDMRYTGDWLFWQNLLKNKGSKIAYSSLTLNYFRTHGATTRSLAAGSTIGAELTRFREYRSFVPGSFLNPFDGRFRWMMAEWIDRGVSDLAKNTRYQYKPLLHPALVIRYYLYKLKKVLTNSNQG